MAIYHCVTKPLSRSTGRSAVAAAAYRAGACLRDERQGIQHDYTRRPGVLHSELVVPEGAGAWTRAALWNAAERAEKQKNSRTAREWEVALPMELPVDAQRDLAVRFARGLAAKYGCAVDVTLHEPDRGGDRRNWHAQLLATTRKVTADRLAEKCAIELGDSMRRSLGLAPARLEITAVRQMWAELVNRQLQEAHRPERVDHRSLAAQRQAALQQDDQQKAAELDRAPQVKLGSKAVQMERRGVPSDRGNQLREVQEENRQRQALVLEIGQLRERATAPAPASNQEVPPADHSPAGQLPGPCSTALFRSGTERPHSGAAIRAVEERPPSRDTIAGSSILG
jgi:MobA/MobL family